MRFIDQTEIIISSGNGGDGIVCFHRAHNLPKLGPDGGSGGHGGSVYFVADSGMNTLAPLKYRQKYQADHGARGGSKSCTGKCGEDLLIKVPLGTIFFDKESGERLGEITDLSTKLLVAEGGKRGLGNVAFVSSLNRAPRQSTKGEKGLTRHLRLELKVLADVGLAGAPNAGKSTLLSRISKAKPKIADYPFTTLHPILGVVEEQRGDQSFVVADIPGLIEGASQGKGLGWHFLRHLSRTRIITFVLDASCGVEECHQTLATLQSELFAFDSQFEDKQRLIVLNKVDLLGEEEIAKLLFSFPSGKIPVLALSAVTGRGIRDFTNLLASHLTHTEMNEPHDGLAVGT
ncbi:MAG: GTPase ObgE [Deltaproteobacteria bacterium]|nr:GTPase ObgE [Deltaproteobacteria bacterium]